MSNVNAKWIVNFKRKGQTGLPNYKQADVFHISVYAVGRDAAKAKAETTAQASRSDFDEYEVGLIEGPFTE